MKLPMVLVDANPKAAPPMAESERSHSGCRRPTLAMAAMAKIRMSIRKMSTTLLVTCGSSLSRFAPRERYVVINLSMATATTATIMIAIIWLRSKSPNRLAGGGVGVGEVTLMLRHAYLLLDKTRV